MNQMKLFSLCRNLKVVHKVLFVLLQYCLSWQKSVLCLKGLVYLFQVECLYGENDPIHISVYVVMFCVLEVIVDSPVHFSIVIFYFGFEFTK
jgi:hypothetical protein